MKATLDLDDNPFDPIVEGLGRIGGQSLAVDVYPGLERLLSTRAASMDQWTDEISFALFGDEKPPAPVKGDMIILILGVQGSGRSTMASLIRKWFVAQSAETPAQWKRFDLCFDPFEPAPTPPVKVEEQFKTLRDDLTREFGDKAGNALVLIDNTPKGSFDRVMSAFNAFPRVRRVFIATSDDADLWNRDLDAAGPRIEKIILRKLGPGDVRELMMHRLPQYRAGTVTGDMIAKFPLFPFDVSAPQSIVGEEGKPFRAVNASLRKRIDAKHRELVQKNAADIASADLADLKARLIS